MNRAGTGGRKANTKLASMLCVSCGHESSCFFVAYRDEANFALPLAQSFDDRIDAVSDDPENKLNLPSDQSFNEDIGRVEIRIGRRFAAR
jgi:hypothetical protein